MTRSLWTICLLPLSLLFARGCSGPEGTETNIGTTGMPALPAEYAAGKAIY